MYSMVANRSSVGQGQKRLSRESTEAKIVQLARAWWGYIAVEWDEGESTVRRK
jgi:hypothetical protein